MDNRTMLELAAKAAGVEGEWSERRIGQIGAFKCIQYEKWSGIGTWNPLTNDGDALRLAVKLKLCFGPNFDGDLAVCFGDNGRNITEAFGADHYAATRRAITRAAAEIQLSKESGK